MVTIACYFAADNSHMYHMYCIPALMLWFRAQLLDDDDGYVDAGNIGSICFVCCYDGFRITCIVSISSHRLGWLNSIRIEWLRFIVKCVCVCVLCMHCRKNISNSTCECDIGPKRISFTIRIHGKPQHHMWSYFFHLRQYWKSELLKIDDFSKDSTDTRQQRTLVDRSVDMAFLFLFSLIYSSPKSNDISIQHDVRLASELLRSEYTVKSTAVTTVIRMLHVYICTEQETEKKIVRDLATISASNIHHWCVEAGV